MAKKKVYGIVIHTKGERTKTSVFKTQEAVSLILRQPPFSIID